MIKTLIKTLIFILLFEIIFSIFDFPKDYAVGDIFEHDPHTVFRLKQNISRNLTISSGEKTFSIKHNSRGLRDYEHNNKSDYRILALGDSFAYGWGVEFEESFLYLFEKCFGFEIIKAGIPGYSIKHERLFLEFYGLDYLSDSIMVIITPSDLIDLKFNSDFIVKDGFLIDKNISILINLYKKSRICRIILKYVSKFWRSNYSEKDWNRMSYELDLMKNINKDIIIVYIPDRNNDIRLWHWLYNWCSNNNVKFIDIPFCNDCYYKEGHLNKKGHALVANTLSDKIKR